MQAIVEFSVVPIGVGVELSPYVAACERVLQQSGLSYELHPNGTGVEGEWEAVFSAINQCHQTLHEMGVPRISTQIHLGTRTDRQQTMGDKVRSVQEKLRTS